MEFSGFTLLLFLSLIALAPFTHAGNFNYCDKKANYDVKVDKIEIFPQPLTRGQPATFNISASAAGAVPKGKLIVDVSYFWFDVYDEVHDLCEETTCPVMVGDFVISHTQQLPGYTPPGSYTLKMKMLDESENELTCIEFGFSIGFLSMIAES